MKNYLYEGWLKILGIYHNGKRYEKLELYSGVCGLIINQDQKILLVKQYRPCVGKYSWEIPAGCLDKEGEPRIEALIREIKEETDIDKEQINKITPIMEYCSILGCSDSKSYVYLVDVSCEAIDKKIDGDDEVEEIKWVTFEDFGKMYSNGEILDNKTQRSYDYIKYVIRGK